MSKIICIDPGHGGIDPGGGSNKQFLEKNMVLNISLEQKKHFERNGIKVVMTRTTDEYLDSVPRTNRVKASGVKYCISNHINAGGGEGAETIHSIYSNSVIADGILNALVALGAKKRRVFCRSGSNGDYYYMHRMTGGVSAIIVEYGFADNASDTKKILNDWKKYAEAVARYYIESVFKQKYIPDKIEEIVQAMAKELTDAQERMRQYLMSLGITDGKNPDAPVTNLVAWSLINQTIRVVYADMKKTENKLLAEINKLK